MKTLIRNAINRSRTPEEEIAQHIIAVDTKNQTFVHHMNVVISQLEMKSIDAAISNQDRSLLIKDGVFSPTVDDFDTRIVNVADGFTREHAAFQAAFTSPAAREIAESEVFGDVLRERIKALMLHAVSSSERQELIMLDIREGTGAFTPETMKALADVRQMAVNQINAPQPVSNISLKEIDLQAGNLAGVSMMAVWSAYSVNALADDAQARVGDRLDRSLLPDAADLRKLVDYVQAHEVELAAELGSDGEQNEVGLNV